MMGWHWITKSSIDDYVRGRDVDALTNLVRHGHELAPEVRDYLASVVADLLDGNRKFPRRRPKKKNLFSEKHRIRVKVWEALQSQGHKLPISLANGTSRLLRGKHSIKRAVADVAKELKCSETTVWAAWAGFDPLSYEWCREKHQHDYELDLAMEFRAEAALESLQREYGNKAEFSDEEIEARAEDLDEDWRSDYDN
jgi:hypothetical protein